MAEILDHQKTPQHQAANVLFFPTYGQPKVDNPVQRGPKKGCISFMNAQRRRLDPEEAERARMEKFQRARAQKALGIKGADIPVKFSKDAQELLERAYDMMREVVDLSAQLKKATAPLAK